MARKISSNFIPQFTPLPILMPCTMFFFIENQVADALDVVMREISVKHFSQLFSKWLAIRFLENVLSSFPS